MINASIKAGTMWKNKWIAIQLNSVFNQRIFQSQRSFKYITSKDKTSDTHDMKAYKGTGGTAAHIPNSGSTWRSVVCLSLGRITAG